MKPTTILFGQTTPALSLVWRTVLLAPPKQACSAIDCLVAGMVVRGLGVEAICLYLELSQAGLLERVVALDLPTPHDRPLRKAGGLNPWSVADTRRLIQWWLEALHLDGIGGRLGRSPGGVRAKARRLGLPRRDRKALVRLPLSSAPALATDTPDVAVAADAAPVVSAVPVLAATLGLPARVVGDMGLGAAVAALSVAADLSANVKAEVSIAGTVASAKGPRQRKWTEAELDELATRSWANQHWLAIARDMNRSPGSTRSQLSRLELPRHNRSKLVETYDAVKGPVVAAENIEAAGYVRRICRVTQRPFWTHRSVKRLLSRQGEKCQQCRGI
jgi:hypothetical protein